MLVTNKPLYCRGIGHHAVAHRTRKGQKVIFSLTGLQSYEQKEKDHETAADRVLVDDPAPSTPLTCAHPVEEFLCAICHDVMMRPPIVNGCGHSFYKDCLNMAIVKSATCPMCRTRFMGASPYIMMQQILAKQLVVCPHERCRSKVKATELPSHWTQCLFAGVQGALQRSEDRADRYGARCRARNRELHRARCPYVRTPCSCGAVVLRKCRALHEATCPDALVDRDACYSHLKRSHQHPEADGTCKMCTIVLKGRDLTKHNTEASS